MEAEPTPPREPPPIQGSAPEGKAAGPGPKSVRLAALIAAVGGLLMLGSLPLPWESRTYTPTGLPPSTGTWTGLELTSYPFSDTRTGSSLIDRLDPSFTESVRLVEIEIVEGSGGAFLVVITVAMGVLALLLVLFTLRRQVWRRLWIVASVISVLALGWLIYAFLWADENLGDKQIGAIIVLIGGVTVLVGGVVTAVQARRARARVNAKH